MYDEAEIKRLVLMALRREAEEASREKASLDDNTTSLYWMGVGAALQVVTGEIGVAELLDGHGIPGDADIEVAELLDGVKGRRIRHATDLGTVTSP